MMIKGYFSQFSVKWVVKGAGYNGFVEAFQTSTHNIKISCFGNS